MDRIRIGLVSVFVPTWTAIMVFHNEHAILYWSKRSTSTKPPNMKRTIQDIRPHLKRYQDDLHGLVWFFIDIIFNCLQVKTSNESIFFGNQLIRVCSTSSYLKALVSLPSAHLLQLPCWRVSGCAPWWTLDRIANQGVSKSKGQHAFFKISKIGIDSSKEDDNCYQWVNTFHRKDITTSVLWDILWTLRFLAMSLWMFLSCWYRFWEDGPWSSFNHET